VRYIEVLTRVRVEREIEACEATLEVSVSAGRRQSCADESHSLREKVLAELKKAGLADRDIREGGGQASQTLWSASKSIVHRVVIRNASMDLLMSAMAAVERLFAEQPQRMFAGVKRYFTFHSPAPIYVANASADDATRDAIRRSRATAELLANASGVRLRGVLTIRECALRRPTGIAQRDHLDFTEDTSDCCLAEIEPDGAVPYSGLPASTGKAIRTFVVRYAIDDAEPEDEGERG
jgi:hypothetical protein